MSHDIFDSDSDLTDIENISERLSSKSGAPIIIGQLVRKRVKEQSAGSLKKKQLELRLPSFNVLKKSQEPPLLNPKLKIRTEYLTEAPVIELGEGGAMQKIIKFLRSPTPLMFCGSTNLDGVTMEYYLRKMIGASLGGDIRDIIGLSKDKFSSINESIAAFKGGKQSCDELGNSRIWGQRSNENDLVWEESMAALYAKKQFVECGIFSPLLKSKFTDSVSRFHSDKDFKFSLPSNGILSEKVDFDLSFDIFELIYQYGGASKMRRINNSQRPNIFVDRKQNKEFLPAVCFCEIPEQGVACGELCINRCMYIECIENCPAGVKCSNKQFQRQKLTDYTKRVGVQGYPGRGYGLCSKVAIDKDSFIIEYRGEVINSETLLQRMNSIYLHAKNHYFLTYGKNEVIDGYRKGTIARFANHSCDPNCHIEKWLYTLTRTVAGEFRVGLFALRNILADEELTYDYRFESFGQMQKCSCGAVNCRGYIGLNKRDVPHTSTGASGSKSRQKAHLNEKDDSEPKNGLLVYGRRIKRKFPRKLIGSTNNVFLTRNLRERVKPRSKDNINTIVEHLHDALEEEQKHDTSLLTYRRKRHAGVVDSKNYTSTFLATCKSNPKYLLLRNLCVVIGESHMRPVRNKARSLDEIVSSLITECQSASFMDKENTSAFIPMKNNAKTKNKNKS